MSNFELKILSGSSNPELAAGIAKYLGKSLTETKIKKFKDGEIGVQVMKNVRGCDVFLIQSTSTPVNDHLIEGFLLIDALKRASASRITIVNPYYGYARQDRKTKPRVPISSALMAQLYESAGVQRLMGLDLHCGQIQGFFRIPVDNLTAKNYLIKKLLKEYRDLTKVCVVSPDAGGAERAYSFVKSLKEQDTDLKVSMAMMNKHREEANTISTMELVGDVKGLDCVIVDDMIDTAGTLCKAAGLLKKSGAKRIICCASHGLFNDTALKRIESSVLEKVIVTNSIRHNEQVILKTTKKIVFCSVAALLGESIRRFHNGESVSVLF